MSDRERWVVYPLLFFSIGLSLYNRVAVSQPAITPVVQCNQLECNSVRVLGANGQEQALLTERGLVAHSVRVTAPDGEDRMILETAPNDAGQLQLLGAEGQLRLSLGSDTKDNSGALAIFSGSDSPVALVAADGDGGSIGTFTEAGKRLVYITHDAKGSGTMVSFDAEGTPHFYLTATLRQQPGGGAEATQPEQPDPDATEEPSAPSETPAEESPASDENPS